MTKALDKTRKSVTHRPVSTLSCTELRTYVDDQNIETSAVLDHIVSCSQCRIYMAERTCD